MFSVNFEPRGNIRFEKKSTAIPAIDMRRKFKEQHSILAGVFVPKKEKEKKNLLSMPVVLFQPLLALFSFFLFLIYRMFQVGPGLV